MTLVCSDPDSHHQARACTGFTGQLIVTQQSFASPYLLHLLQEEYDSNQSPTSVEPMNTDKRPSAMLTMLLRQLSSQLSTLFKLFNDSRCRTLSPAAAVGATVVCRLQDIQLNNRPAGDGETPYQQLGCMGGMGVCFQAAMYSVTSQIDRIRSGSSGQSSPYQSLNNMSPDSNNDGEGSPML